MLRRLERRLGDRPPGVTISLATVLSAVVAVLDFVTQAELAFSLFYVVPVALLVWFVGTSAATLAAAVGAALSLYLDLHSEATFSHAVVPYWNALASAGLYVAAILLLQALKRAIAEEKELARTDPLTGAANPRKFFEIAEMEMARSRRYEHPFTVVYVDVDDFKEVNDRFGHARGDDILKRVSRRISATARHSDLVARLGGDEFGILLPETPAAGGARFSVRVKDRLVDELRILGDGVTVSVGAVTFMEPPSSVEDMIATADALMYEVKRSGKNGVRHRVATGSVSLEGSDLRSFIA